MYDIKALYEATSVQHAIELLQGMRIRPVLLVRVAFAAHGNKVHSGNLYD